MTARHVAVVLAFVLSACSSSASQPDAGPPEANPIVPEVAAFPFPSDFYLVEDTGTETGRRVDIPAEALPERIPTSVVEGMDGFSRMPIIATYLGAGVDPNTLLALDDHAGSIAADAPVQLLEEGSWEAIPILAETDLTATLPENRSLLIRPLRLLDANKGYVVVIRNSLRNDAGEAFQPSTAFLALRDDEPTNDPSIESQRESFTLVKQALSERGIAPADVLQAWSFHTRSEASVTQDLLAIQDIANSATLGDYEIISDEIQELEEGATNRQIVATFKAPNFIGEDDLLARDAQGQVEQRGTRDVEFSLTIPSTVDELRPVIIYGHGFFGSYRQATRGSVTDIGHEYRFSAAGTNIGFTEDNELATILAITDLKTFPELVADVQQNITNQTSLARLIREVLADDIEQEVANGPAIKVFDASKVHYYGISNGGTFGFLATATSPQFERAALMVGGGGLIHFLERAVNWREYSSIVEQALEEPRERQLAFSIMQMAADPIDPINYARNLVHNRFPGRAPMAALVGMAVNDSQVRNLLTEWVARSADLPLVTPSPKEVFGLRQKSAEAPGLDEPGGFVIYDEEVEPSPRGNIPPLEDNDTHGTLRYVPAYRTQLGTFLETGKIINFCEGACDPQ
jgi:pimeloyl-ACP methyl ester carboxylesterase